MSAFLNDWAETSWSGTTGLDTLKSDFAITDDDLAGVNIIVASYTYENYEGDAYVLFERDGKLFEVHGGHCSCYGLEGQWEPEEVTVADLRANLVKSSSYGDQAKCREHILAAVEAREALGQ